MRTYLPVLLVILSAPAAAQPDSLPPPKDGAAQSQQIPAEDEARPLWPPTLRLGAGTAVAGSLVLGAGFQPVPVAGPPSLDLRLDLNFGDNIAVSFGTGTQALIPYATILRWTSIRQHGRVDVAWRSTGKVRWSLGASLQAGLNVPILMISWVTGIPFPFPGGDVLGFIGPGPDVQLGVVGSVEYEIDDNICIVAELPVYAGIWMILPGVLVTPGVGVRWSF